MGLAEEGTDMTEAYIISGFLGSWKNNAYKDDHKHSF